MRQEKNKRKQKKKKKKKPQLCAGAPFGSINMDLKAAIVRPSQRVIGAIQVALIECAILADDVGVVNDVAGDVETDALPVGYKRCAGPCGRVLAVNAKNFRRDGKDHVRRTAYSGFRGRCKRCMGAKRPVEEVENVVRTRKCTSCRLDLPLDDKHFRRDGKRHRGGAVGYRSRCKECLSQKKAGGGNVRGNEQQNGHEEEQCGEKEQVIKFQLCHSKPIKSFCNPNSSRYLGIDVFYFA